MNEVKSCLMNIKRLEENKFFYYCFYQELITGQTPEIINLNYILELKYLRFKYQYMQELASCNYLVNNQYYLNEINPTKTLEVA